ncbi:MAG: anthranilate synthase component I family protein, partial [Thermodesulfobacteriota bacterium]
MSVIELDMSTSVEGLFRRVAKESGAFWLDGERTDGATFMGFAPRAQLVLRADGRLVEIADERRRALSREPLQAMEDFVAGARAGDVPDGVPHTVGYFAYDLAHAIEPRIRPRRGPRARLPLALLARYDAVLEVRDTDEGARGERSRGRCEVRVHAPTTAAAERAACAVRDATAGAPPERRASGRPARIVEQPRVERHVAAVERALAYIAAGDVYQVNLAQRFRVASDEPASETYLRMRAAQHVPYGVFLHCGRFAVLCGSPERFVRVAGSTIETEPIKGTRPRAADPAGDAALQAALLGDPKERAEHVMIVDLERNDLGRICATGSVQVPSLMRVESFATLHHLVSTVRGTLRDDVGLAALLRATFPGGSITGAPKIRAAQVIAELEQQPREIYTGAVAWFRGARDFDSAIAIRTAVACDGVYTYHAGGGIVADSDPRREHD